MFIKTCKKCLLPENYPGIDFNSKQECSYCLGEKHYGVTNDPAILYRMSQKDKLKDDFEKILRECKGQAEYDCLVPLSGGKDSTYLAYLLKEKYDLNILGVTVDTGFMSPVALSNLEQLVSKLDIDYILCSPKSGFFKKLYAYFLTHPKFEKEKHEEIGYVSTVCRICTKAMHSILLKEAMIRGIPIILLGYSSDQIEHHFYEIPQKEIKEKSWIPEELYHKPFDEEDRSYFWDPKRYPQTELFPRILFPYHVIGHPNIAELKQKVMDLGLIKNRRKSDPLLTNCQLNLLMMCLDFKKLGYNSYIPAFSHQIREGKESRMKYLWLFRGLNCLMKSGIYMNILHRKKINFIKKCLDLKLKDFLQVE